MTDTRAAFEAWAVSEEAELDLTTVRNENLRIEAYVKKETFAAWKGWQAAINHERAECAKVCEEIAPSGTRTPWSGVEMGGNFEGAPEL
jgi:hypothetical protein